jgi:hypothetical protein
VSGSEMRCDLCPSPHRSHSAYLGRGVMDTSARSHWRYYSNKRTAISERAGMEEISCAADRRMRVMTWSC